MRKHYLYCAALATAAMLCTQAQASSFTPDVIRPQVVQTLAARPATATTADDNKTITTLIDEDFSGLTAGSEDAPDGTKLVDAMGDFTNPSALKPYSEKLSDKKWGGEGLYSAGGCIAIKDGWFLNTPAGDMSGEVTLTFRARLVKGQQTWGENTLDLIFLSRKALVDFGRKTFTLTDEWQTFTFTSDKGEFENTGFQFFSNVNSGTVLIDDIHVQSVKQSIAAPTAQDPQDATEYGFKAVWSPTSEAKKYLLSVYSKEENDGIESVNEGFEGIHAQADGVIDAAAPGYPEGWEFKWKDATKAHAAPHGGPETSPQAIRLTDEGDYLSTPTVKQGLTTMRFWVKAETSQTDIPSGSRLALSFDTDYGLYLFAYLDLSQLLTDDAKDGTYIDLTEAIGMFDGVYGLKAEWMPVNGDHTALLLDDFNYTSPKAPTLHYVMQDQEVPAPAPAEGEEGEENVTYEVSGLDPNLDYFYSVKAANDDYVSAASKEKEVYTVSQPTALAATNVTADSYTANWTCNKKVDFFRVEQIQQNDITADTKDYEILHEDFSKVNSRYSESDLAQGLLETGDYTGGYVPIDSLTHIAGWKASSMQRVEGWLGGMASSGQTGQIAGAIVTPTIDLSHNEGECNVTVRAWGTEDDWLVVQGVNAAAYAAIRFPAGGFVEQTVTVPVCTAKESLTFYSNNYKPFLIDYIRITQDVKAGEKVSVTTASVHTADADARSLVMERPNFGAHHDVCYKVTGLRYYHGNVKDAVASSPSELITVQPPTGIASLTADAAESITSTEGGVRIASSHATAVKVYTPAGILVASRTLPAGQSAISLSPGIYVVKTAHTTAKVVVE